MYQFSFQSLSSVQLFVTPWTAAHQASLPFTVFQSLLKLMSIELMRPSNHLILCHPFVFCPQSFPGSVSFPMSQFFTSRGQSIGASAPASVLLINSQGYFPLGLTGLISLLYKGLSRDFQHRSSKASSLPAPQFESINSSALSLLYSPTVTSIYDYWKNHSFDCMDLCQQIIDHYL